MSTPDQLATFGAGAGTVDPDRAPLDDQLDGELAPVGIDAEPSELEQLSAELAKDVLPTLTLPVPGRPGYALTFRLDVTDRDLDAWRKRAKDKGMQDGVSGTRFALVGLASTCTAVLRNGKPVELAGKPATFRSRAFLDVLGVTTAAAGVLKLYGLEGNVDAAIRAVLKGAGWGDELEEVREDGDTEDPT